MGLARLKSALNKLRGVADLPEIPAAPFAGVPQHKLEQFAQESAAACSELCRNAILQNMASVGIKSAGLTAAINRGDAYFWTKRGVLRFRLAGGFNPYPERTKQGGVWMVAAAQDAGRVVGIPAQAARAKRTIKKGLANAKTFGKVGQVHNGRVVSREAINAAGVSVVPAKPFWEFNAGQAAAIRAMFRKHFTDLVARYHGRPT